MTVRGSLKLMAALGLICIANQSNAQLIDPWFFGKTEPAPFERAKISVESETLDSIAPDLALLSGNIVIPNRVRAQMVVVGLALDPENPDLTELNAGLEQEQPPYKIESDFNPDEVARKLVDSAYRIQESWKKTGSEDSKKLSSMLLDICFAIYPEDPKLTYTRDMFLRENPPFDWRNNLVEIGRGSGPKTIVAAQFPKTGLQLKQTQSGARALLIRELPNGMMAGKGSRMSATYIADRRGSAEGVRFNQEVGDYMEESLINLKSFMAKRHGDWFDEGYVEFAFQEKFVFKDGDSAGVACALMIESIVTGFKVDPAFTCSGAINPDGTVGAIGGVVAKLRGAEKSGASLIAVPFENSYALNDLVVLGEAENLARLQVFVVNEFEEAMALARTDRSPEMKASMADFAKLQAQFSGGVVNVIKTPEAQQLLTQILERTPNHASAQLMRQVASGSAPKRLSLNGSLEQLMGELAYVMQVVSVDRAGNGRPVVEIDAPPSVTASRLKSSAARMQRLETLLPEDVVKLLARIRQFRGSLDKMNGNRNPTNSLAVGRSLVEIYDALEEISELPDLIEELDADDGKDSE
ncbi:MAG: hypothetical protein ACI8UO_003652 [Verrucomicrobiales bacterium]|jgi:hypothetical protein